MALDTSWRKGKVFSLHWKLGGALLLVVLVSVGILAVLINQNTASQFQQYVQSGSSAYTQRVVTLLEQHYARQKNWSGVQEILSAALRNSSDRLVLVDDSGKIVGDTAGQAPGQSFGNISAVSGILIQSAGQTVGTLYPFLSSLGMGMGYMGGRGNSGTPTHTLAQTSENTFLDRINSYIWVAGTIAIMVALLAGIFLTRQITRPLKALNTGAEHISAGDLSYRVKVRSRDEIGRLADSFNTMAARLDDSEQSRRRLVSDVAHELRTPLTIIQGTVDGIADGVFAADKEHLGNIREQTVLLTHLVNDLRDLSLAESGQLKLELHSIDFAELVQRKISQFEVSAQHQNIRLIIDSQKEIPPVNVDSKRIEQVMSNLLSNAIRHTPPGGQITVSLKTIKEDSTTPKASLLVSVADTGEGIPAEHLPYIFERFYRVENSRSRSEGGAGLGLAIVKQMVQAHGGKVRVESQTGQGTTFYIALPYRQ
jgi:two-component system sensor histidine kinase BaeS